MASHYKAADSACLICYGSCGAPGRGTGLGDRNKLPLPLGGVGSSITLMNRRRLSGPTPSNGSAADRNKWAGSVAGAVAVRSGGPH